MSMEVLEFVQDLLRSGVLKVSQSVTGTGAFISMAEAKALGLNVVLPAPLSFTNAAATSINDAIKERTMHQGVNPAAQALSSSLPPSKTSLVIEPSMQHANTLPISINNNISTTGN